MNRQRPIAARVPAPPGIVLVAVILLLAVLGLTITTSALVIAQADAAARGRADGLRARLAAESAARSAARAWEPAALRRLGLLDERAIGGSLALPGGAVGRATVRRLGVDLFLIAAEGAAGQARSRAGMLVRVLSIASLMPPFPAALSSEGGVVEAGAHVTVDPPEVPPPGWSPTDCVSGASDTLLAVFGDAARPGILATGSMAIRAEDVNGSPPIAPGTPTPSVGLGPLGWDQLALWADRTEAGTIILAPAVRAGICDQAAPGNWGDPRNRMSPCSSWYPLIYAPGDLRVAAGSGQGVLVVRGTLMLDAGVEFYGPILAGAATVAPDARIRGALSAGTVSFAGAVAFSPCAILRALSSAPALGRPFRTGPRLWARFF